MGDSVTTKKGKKKKKKAKKAAKKGKKGVKIDTEDVTYNAIEIEQEKDS